jgi:hypothetical protein
MSQVVSYSIYSFANANKAQKQLYSNLQSRTLVREGATK